MVLILPQGHESSEYVLSFEIGQREGGFYSARTDGLTETPSTVLVYRLTIWFQQCMYVTFQQLVIYSIMYNRYTTMFCNK